MSRFYVVQMKCESFKGDPLLVLIFKKTIMILSLQNNHKYVCEQILEMLVGIFRTSFTQDQFYFPFLEPFWGMIFKLL